MVYFPYGVENMSLSKEECETIIRCNATDKEWEVCTADRRIKTKLKRRGYVPVKDHQFSDPFEVFVLPFDKISILKSEPRKISPDSLAKARSYKRLGKTTPVGNTKIAPPLP